MSIFTIISAIAIVAGIIISIISVDIMRSSKKQNRVSLRYQAIAVRAAGIGIAFIGVIALVVSLVIRMVI